MYKVFARIIALIVVVSVLAAIAGCENDGMKIGIRKGGKSGKTSEARASEADKESGTDEVTIPPPTQDPTMFSYVAHSLPLPADLGDINNLVYVDNNLYFTSSTYEYDEETLAETHGYSIYSCNTDGTDLKQLPDFVPYTDTFIDDIEKIYGGIFPGLLYADGDGNLWVIENYAFHTYDLPAGFDPERDNRWEYYRELDYGFQIRKLDLTGSELLSLDIGFLDGKYWIYAFELDAMGNIYLLVNDWNIYGDMIGGLMICVFDSSGKKHFELTAENSARNLIRMPDGTVATFENNYDLMSYDLRVQESLLRPIDFDAKAFRDPINTPHFASDAYQGNCRGYDFIYSDNINMYGFAAGSDEPKVLLNWLESGVLVGDLRNLRALPDGNFLCTNRRIDLRTDKTTFEIILLERKLTSELPSKETLTLATLNAPMVLRERVLSFNETNPEYRIKVIDYAEFVTDYDMSTGYARMCADIDAGKPLDIINLQNLPYVEYARRGLLADLYPFIDSDPTLSRSDFVRGSLKAAEVDGSLYQVFDSFGVRTLVGNPRSIGQDIGWDLDEFMVVLNRHPKADIPLGMWLSSIDLLQELVAFSVHDYIDWETGGVSFDSPDFIKLLECAKSVSFDFGSIDISDWDSFYVEQSDAIAMGRQLMVQIILQNLGDYRYCKALFGGEVVLKGYPSSSRNGGSLTVENGLAIAETSENKNAAWSFVKTLLDGEWQSSTVRYSFPTNREVFDERMRIEIGAEGAYDYYWNPVEPISQEDVDAIDALIDSAFGVSGLDFFSSSIDPAVWKIISDCASDYFEDYATAQDTARLIQERVLELLSEREDIVGESM